MNLTIATISAAMLAVALAALPAFAHGNTDRHTVKVGRVGDSGLRLRAFWFGDTDRHVVRATATGAINIAIGGVFKGGSKSDRRKAACAGALAEAQKVADRLPGRHVARRADWGGLFVDGCMCHSWAPKGEGKTQCSMAVNIGHPSSGNSNTRDFYLGDGPLIR